MAERRNPRGQNSPGGKPNEGVPGKGIDRADLMAAVANINTPGVTADMVRSLLVAGKKQGLGPNEVTRFIQSPYLTVFGEGDQLQSGIDTLTTAPGGLATAIRLSRELNRFNYDKPESGNFIGKRGTFQTLLAGFHPEIKDALVRKVGRTINPDTGDVVDEEGNIDEELNSLYGPAPDQGPVITGEETTLGLNESVKSMMTARAQREASQSYYGDFFSYDELLGGGEQ